MKKWIVLASIAILFMLSVPRDAPFHPVYRKIKVTVQTVYFHFKYANSPERKRPWGHEQEDSSGDPHAAPPRSRKLMEQMGENAKDERPETFDDRLEETFENWKKEEEK